MRLMIKILLACWIWPITSFGQTVFVDSAESFSNALLRSGPGHTIIIRDGVYTDWGSFVVSSTQDGSIDRWLTITGETKGGVVFRGPSSLSLIVRSQYLVISNLTFESHGKFDSYGEGAAGIDGILVFDGAQDILVKDNAFLGLHGDGVVIPIMEYRGNRETRRLTFENNLVDGYVQTGRSAFSYMYGGLSRGTPREIVWRNNIFKNRQCDTTIQYCYWLKFGDSTDSLTYDSDLVLEGNTFQDDDLAANGQYALHLQGTGIILTGNHFQNVGPLTFRNGSGHLIARNTFIDSATDIQEAQIQIHGANHEIVGNACTSTSYSRICLSLGKGTVDSGNGDVGPDYDVFRDSLIAHNSFSGFIESAITMAHDYVGHYDGKTTVFPSGIEFHNNMVVQSVGTMFIGNDCISEFESISHNGRSGAASAGCMSEGTNNVTTDPQWKVNTVSPLYGSPLINAGVALPDHEPAKIDIFGLRRDSSPDIGAVEWGGHEPPDESETPDDVCNRLFGEAQNYVLCEGTTESCSFNVKLAGQTCGDICGVYGKSCLGATETDGLSCQEIAGSTDDCNTARDEDEICLCDSENPLEDPEPRTVTIRYVDSLCEMQGDGTTATCGATGPWNSIEYALNTVKCIGMIPGDVLLIKGSASVAEDGNWYNDVFHSPSSVVPDSECAGILIQNVPSEHAVLDGTLDIKDSTWVHIGDDVYECQDACGTVGNFPFTAWVGISGTEHRLDLIQTQRACDVSLAAGKMTYNDVSRRVCVHLPDDSSPANADYVRIPYYPSAFDFTPVEISGIVFRANPLGGSFTATRYRDRIFDFNPSMNSDITVDGWDLSWARGRAVSIDENEGDGGFYIVNNHIHHIGQDGIAWLKDMAFSIISDNEIHDIGMAPVFEQCNEIGDGCFAAYANSPSAIRINNCTEDTLPARSLILGNEIYNIGSGREGISYGIHLQNCSYFNKIDSNLIYDSTASGAGFRAIMFSGIPQDEYHDKNIVTNTRCENSDICLATNFLPWDTTEEFEQFADQRGRRNYFLGNTCYNPLLHCWLQEDGGETEGELILRNNLAAIDSDYLLLMSAIAPTFWVNEFRHNGFQCSHDDCVGEVIADFNGTQYKREGDCTEGIDCITDISIGAGNLYGVFDIQPDTLEIITGSDAINTAEDIEFLPADFQATRRPLGLTSDMGAHEFTGFSSDISLAQGSYRFYERFSSDGRLPISDENGIVNLHTRSEFTLRIGIYGNPDSSKDTVYLALYAQHCNPSCGDYIPVTLNCDDYAICLVDNPNYRDGHPLASSLSLQGREFLETSNYVDGEKTATRNGHLIGAHEQLETEFSLRIGNVVVGNIVNLRMYYVNGVEIEDYVVTPSITVGTTYDTIEINRQ